ncbi:MAG TPA: c-type cytochrome domain-containing protein [Bryobacteraceae bacterium]|nr:c-type cytochrome domain-containing protein [Bryobacteraceae bacterium]
MRIAALAIGALLPLAARAQQAPSFARDVLPIFESNCSGCHASNVKMGSLDLDTFEGLMKGGNNGTVIVPGKSAESRLYLMVTGQAAPAMPLSGKKLAQGEIETIRKWIDAGARPPAPGEVAAKHVPAIPDIKPRVPVKPEIGSLAWRPDGKLLALGAYREVRLVNPETRQTVATLGGHAQEVRSVAFSPDGKLLAAAGGLPARNGEVKIWDVEKRAELRTIHGHADCIYSVAFSPDGKSVATSSYDKLIKLWDVATGQEIRTLKDHIDSVFALAFTPDGKRLVSAAADRSVKVWDVASGERLYTLSDAQDGLNCVALDPAGKRVAAGGLDKTIRVWSLGEKGGKLLNSLIAHEDAILQIAWSPDGKYLASSAADRTIKVFQADDLTEVRTLGDQPDWVMALEFAPDGKSVAAGRFDGSLTIYPAADWGRRPVAHVAQR